MNYFAIQVATRREDEWLARMRESVRSIRFHKIMKRMYVRRQGKMITEDAPLFPGYIFMEFPDKTLPAELLYAIRHSRYFIRFLPSNESPHPLDQHDSEIIRHWLVYGGRVPVSLVTFDEHQRIRVVDGPLKGMEGNIIKVDRRKRRAKIQITLAASPMTLDLAFDLLEPDTEHAAAEA